MVDTHTHLNFQAFDNEVGGVIKRAKAVGVEKFVVPGSNLETSQKAVDLARRYPEVFAAVSIHPYHSKEMSLEILERFFVLISKEKVVAVGETGLDFYHFDKVSKYADRPTIKEQQIVFTEMLKLAQDARLPIILHCREAYQELFEILINEGVRGPGVIHCFMGSIGQAKRFLESDFFISFTGNITYSDSLTEVVEFVPLDRLLLETDSPYLSPEIYRGKRNEPAYLTEIAKRIAEIKKIPLVEVEKTTTANAERLFRLT